MKRISLKEKNINICKAYEKLFCITNHQEDVNQSSNEISHQSDWHTSKIARMTTTGMDVEKEFSLTVG